MSIAHLLEDFAVDPQTSGAVHLMHEDALEEQRLAAFEQGYTAGWDDAVKAQSDTRARLDEALVKSIEDASFTYHEALASMSASLEPMFQSLVDTVLPQTIEAGFSQRIAEQLGEMARAQTGQPALLVVGPGVSADLKPLLAREFPMPVQLVEEATIEPGQASLRVGRAECDVDCAALMTQIHEALGAFVYQSREVSMND